MSGEPRLWEREAAAAPVPLPVHRLDAAFLPAGRGLLLRPDDVVALRGTDVTAPPRMLWDLLLPAAVATATGT